MLTDGLRTSGQRSEEGGPAGREASREGTTTAAARHKVFLLSDDEEEEMSDSRNGEMMKGRSAGLRNTWWGLQGGGWAARLCSTGRKFFLFGLLLD